MKIVKRIGIVIGCIVLLIGVVWLCLGDKLSLLYTSLNSFRNENLAYTFQHTPEIQPTVKIERSAARFIS